MADPLLTALCAICHVSAPKYKCPRCRLQTCSAACIKKHKAWSDCSGERDETAYVPPSRLRTAVGFNHDYNFLHKMDRLLERTERDLVADRGIVRREELRPPQAAPQTRWKTGRDGRRQKVVVAAKRTPCPEPSGRRIDRVQAARLRLLNVGVVRAPLGMARQRENGTTFNRRSGGLNWQVEWLALANGEGSDVHDNDAPVTRIMSKALEDEPLFRAYHAARQKDHAAQQKGEQPKRAKRSGGHYEGTQRELDSAWSAAATSMQDPQTGRWSLCACEADDAEPQPQGYRFFLGPPPSGSVLDTTLAPLDARDCLRDVLANRTVYEFPTIYVLRAGQQLPAGFVGRGPEDATSPRRGTKRAGFPGPAEGGEGFSGSSAKRRRLLVDEDGLEDGEVGMAEGEGGDGEGEDGEDEDDTGDEEALDGFLAGESGREESEGGSSSTSSSGSDDES